MNFNPLLIKNILKTKKDFFNGHPDLYQMFLSLAKTKIKEGDEFTISFQLEGEEKKVTAVIKDSDLDFIESLQKLGR